MSYEAPYQDPYNPAPEGTEIENPYNVGTGTGIAPPSPTTPPPAQGGYDLEKFRKAWYGKGDFNNIQGWLDQNKAFTTGVTLRGDKAYDPSGKFIADLVGNMNDPSQTKHAQFLDGIGSNGRPRTATPPPTAPRPPTTTTPPPTAPPVPTPTAPPGGSVAPIRDPRLDELYNTLMARANQGLAVDRNNPVIRGQADAFSANQERSRRNYLADTAEGAGPTGNIRNETRLSAERVGQASGEFESQLMGREVQAKRDEIAQALASTQGLLTEEQRLALQNQLTRLNDETQRLGLSNQNSQFYAGLNQNQNQFGRDLDYRNRALNQNDYQFRDQMGFNYGDRSNYWDWMNRQG